MPGTPWPLWTGRKTPTIRNRRMEGYILATADYIKSFDGPLEDLFLHARPLSRL